MKLSKKLADTLNYRLSFIIGYLEDEDVEFAIDELQALCEELEAQEITPF